MEYQWGAGCTERCKSGSERGLQKPVSQRHKALLSYSPMLAHPHSPHGRTARATIVECWKCAMRRIRRVWISPCCCAPARAAHGPPTGCSMRAWLRRFRWPTAARALHPLRLRCPISVYSIPHRSPAAARTDRSALCRSDEVALWAHSRQRPTAAQRLATHSTALPRGAQAAAAARVRARIRALLPRNPA